MNAGDALGPYTIGAVDPALMRVTSELLADPNPIHLDRAAVQALGMGDRLVNQGPTNIGYVVAMLEQAVPGARIADLALRLLDNVFEGDRVHARGVVEDVTGEGHIACSVWLDVDGRGRALDGTATLVPPQ